MQHSRYALPLPALPWPVTRACDVCSHRYVGHTVLHHQAKELCTTLRLKPMDGAQRAGKALRDMGDLCSPVSLGILSALYAQQREEPQNRHIGNDPPNARTATPATSKLSIVHDGAARHRPKPVSAMGDAGVREGIRSQLGPTSTQMAATLPSRCPVPHTTWPG